MVAQQGRTLLITNDFPPHRGGIETFVYGLIRNQAAAESFVVLAPKHPDSMAFDAGLDFEVVRHRNSLLLPEPSVYRTAKELVRRHGCDRLLFGATAPLGLLAKPLRRHGIERTVGITHGHEAAWASTPGAGAVLREMARDIDTLTFLGGYTRNRIAKAIGPRATARMRRLVPGVDHEAYQPDNHAWGDEVRKRLGLADRRVIVCVSRLIPRKGQDTLIKALPLVRTRIPDAALLIVGGGSYRDQLEQLVARTGQHNDVVITGSVPSTELPGYYAAGNVFAMPCRTRNRGWDVEGLGIVYLEASASGLPVIAGNSGGAPDAVLDGDTGFVVDGRQPSELVDRIV